MDNETTQQSSGGFVEITAIKARSTEQLNVMVNTTERPSIETNRPTAEESRIKVDVIRNEDITQNGIRINSDASRRSHSTGFPAVTETDDDSGLQSVFSESMSTLAHDDVSVSEIMPQSRVNVSEEIDFDKTSTPRSVLEESTPDMSVSFKGERSESTATAKTASSALGMSEVETESEALLISTMSSGLKTTWSEGRDTVTRDSQSYKFSSDPTMTTYNEPTTDLLSAGSQATVTGTSDSLVANSTTSELTTETTDAFIVSEVVEISKERSESSSLQATVSEDTAWAQNATTPRSIGSRTVETDLAESQAPSEIVHMTTRRTVKDTARTTNTTDAPTTTRHALLSTSEAARTLHTNDTGPAGRASFYSQAGDTFSTVSEVTSEAPSESPMVTGSQKGPLIGIVVGATVAIVFLVLILVVVLTIIYRRRRRKSCYITDHDLKDYRSLMKRPHEPPALVNPSVVQPISPFSDVFPRDVANNGPPASKYRMFNMDRNSDDGLDGIEIVHDHSREQRSPKEIPVQEYVLTPSGYSNCSYSVNTFRPDERKSKETSTDLTKSDAETKFGAAEASGNDESSGNDEKEIEE